MSAKTFTHKELAQRLDVSETTIKSYRRKFPGCIPVFSQGKPIRFTQEALPICKLIRDLFEQGMSVQEVAMRLGVSFPELQEPLRQVLRQVAAPDGAEQASAAPEAKDSKPTGLESAGQGLSQSFSTAIGGLAQSVVSLTRQQSAILERLAGLEEKMLNLVTLGGAQPGLSEAKDLLGGQGLAADGEGQAQAAAKPQEGPADAESGQPRWANELAGRLEGMEQAILQTLQSLGTHLNDSPPATLPTTQQTPGQAPQQQTPQQQTPGQPGQTPGAANARATSCATSPAYLAGAGQNAADPNSTQPHAVEDVEPETGGEAAGKGNVLPWRQSRAAAGENLHLPDGEGKMPPSQRSNSGVYFGPNAQPNPPLAAGQQVAPSAKELRQPRAAKTERDDLEDYLRRISTLPLALKGAEGYTGLAGRGPFSLNDFKAILAQTFTPPQHYVGRWETASGEFWYILEQPEEKDGQNSIRLHLCPVQGTRGAPMLEVVRFLVGGAHEHPTALYAFVQELLG